MSYFIQMEEIKVMEELNNLHKARWLDTLVSGCLLIGIRKPDCVQMVSKVGQAVKLNDRDIHQEHILSIYLIISFS